MKNRKNKDMKESFDSIIEDKMSMFVSCFEWFKKR